MKKKTFYKEFFRTIKNTKTRFLSIFIIIALGVGFFAGINATEPDMIISADNFYKENKLSDLTIIFPLEISDVDKADILEIDGISYIEEKIIKDVLISEEDKSGEVLRLYSLEEDKNLDEPYIVEGQKPQNNNEILLDISFKDKNKVKIGDNIKLYLEEQEDFNKNFITEDYKISGFALSPKYVSFERGQTNIGSGSISYFGFLNRGSFETDYNSILISIDKNQGINSYSDEYNNKLNFIEEKIEKKGLLSMKKNKKELLDELKDKEKQLNDSKDEVNNQFEEVEKEILEAQIEVDSGERVIIDSTEEFNSKYNYGLAELKKAKKDIIKAKSEYKKNKNILYNTKIKLEDGKKELNQSELQLKSVKKELSNAESHLAEVFKSLKNSKDSIKNIKNSKKNISKELEIITPFKSEVEYLTFLNAISSISKDLENSIKNNVPYDDPNIVIKVNRYMDNYISEFEKKALEGEKDYNDNKLKLENKKRIYENSYNKFLSEKNEFDKQKLNYESGMATLKNGKLILDENEATLNKSEKELYEGKKEFKNKISKEKYKIEEAKEKLEENKILMQEEKDLAFSEIKNSKEKINDGYKDIEKIPNNWIISSRKDYPGYKSYGDDARRMGAVAKVFPLFFFLVAALVSLTTMARMVEEERTQIGTFKALGYKTKQIAIKYILYALFSSFLGSVVGFSIGFKLFPKVIMTVYSAMYNIPLHLTPFHLKYAVISTLIAVITTVSATIIAIINEMQAMPAVLMQVKAPKAGKRIFLEKFNFIWGKLSFSNKVTARNVFRYKRRLFMTILGISGSMALLLTGFGIRDSVNAIKDRQFEDIFIYDGLIFIDDKVDLNIIEKDVLNLKEIGKVEEIYNESILLKSRDNIKLEADIMIPKNSNNFSEFIDLHTREKNYNLDIRDGIIITEKLSKLLDKKIGDKVAYEDKDGEEFEFKISGISENYLLHYIYMSEADYKKLSNKKINYNSFMFNYSKNYETKNFNEEYFQENLLKIDGIQGSLIINNLKNEFSDTLRSLDYVVLILIVSAGALSFIVLYNLTNINITERIREIATIKVLGFRDKEVSSYVYKENIILSLLGALLGLFLGIILHKFVMSTMEIDSMMFGKNINILSYIYSILLSLSFTIIVNIFMHFRLKKIDMVESLKSME